jgi:hypothetical protein
MGFTFGYFSSDEPDQPRELHEKIATSGTAIERWHLAGREDLSPEVIAILAQDADPDVRSVIAGNDDTPAGILASLANQHPDLIPPMSLNLNAPATLKELAPILWHTDESIFLYLKEKGATEEERTQLVKQHDRMGRQYLNRINKARKALPPDEPATYMEPPRTPLLRDVWRAIHPEPGNDAPYSRQFLQAAAGYWEDWNRDQSDAKMPD